MIYLRYIWRKTMMNNYDDIDYEKLNLVKDELLKESEEFLYADKTSSIGEKIDRLVRLVNKSYDI